MSPTLQLCLVRANVPVNPLKMALPLILSNIKNKDKVGI